MKSPLSSIRTIWRNVWHVRKTRVLILRLNELSDQLDTVLFTLYAKPCNVIIHVILNKSDICRISLEIHTCKGLGCKGRVSRHKKCAGSKAKGKTFLYKSYLERAAWSFSKFVSSRKLRSDTACGKICTNDLGLVQWFTPAFSCSQVFTCVTRMN